MSVIKDLVSSFMKLPGVGRISGTRMVNYLLKADEEFLERFALQISELKKKVHPCKVCFSWTESEICPICASPTRDKSTICVVEKAQDVETIETAGGYTGLFHVLGGVIAPLEGVGIDDLNLKPLLKRLETEKVEEVILATNPTFEGDATAMYTEKLIAEHNENFKQNVKVTRLATGIPIGGDLEYADRLTLKRSFSGRKEM